MTQVEAIYHDGIFQPLQNVGLKENQRVRLSVQPLEAADILDWLARVREHREQIYARAGYLPDSTLDIAEDRMR